MAVKYLPEGFHTVTPFLSVADLPRPSTSASRPSGRKQPS